MPDSTIAANVRLLPLTGGFNFRDLGGYATASGERVRWQLLYRSGKLSALTSDDVAHLAPKGIQVVCDLRTQQERASDPSAPGFSPLHRSWDYDVGHSLLRDAAKANGATQQHIHDALAATYAVMPWLYADMYGAAFRHLIDGDLPLVFHCSAGKDRTGTLAALILTALGVPEATVLADYLLTDRYLDVNALINTPRTQAATAPSDPAAAAGFSFIRAMSAEMREPLLKCDPAYLLGALRAVEARHGSVLAYVETVLGVGADDMAKLRSRLLEPLPT